MINTTSLGIEIDFLPVGEGSRSADTIAIRYGDIVSGDRSQQKVIIIDGGTKESGLALIEHIKKFYHTNVVDLVIMTHPDMDHCSGLTEILESLTVRQLWMHQPWNHSADIRRHFSDGRMTNNSLERQIRVALDAAHQVEELALEKGIVIIEPFAGLKSEDGIITVLGPNKEYYQSLIPDFRSTPDSVASKTLNFFKKAIQTITEAFDLSDEKLPGDDTSAENNSSAILLLQLDNQKFLFTGDAGVPALEKANSYASLIGVHLNNLNFIQIPHHGSKKNVNSNILNLVKSDVAFISAAKDGAPKHPSQRVINALIRRNTKVCVTQGNSICFRHNVSARNGWGPADQASFMTSYEE
ncbi:ComEC/Rec2 family competence protein [Adhaeribacter arboris]|nr:MBL fold metallo-hydrolase [Adhaeribacter arboris]